MIFRIVKVLVISAGIIWLIKYANHAFSDWESIYLENITFRTGNEDQWNESLPQEPGAGTLSAQFTLGTNDPFPSHKKELVITFLGSYDLYVNGVLIGKNGTISDSAALERPGLIYQKFILPPEVLTEGSNELVMHFSDHFNKDREDLMDLKVEPYHLYSKWTLIQSSLIYTLAGIFFITAIHYIFLYINTFRKSSYLLFALICGFSFWLTVYAYSIEYYPYTYDHYPVRQSILWSLTTIICLLLPLFYLHYFDHPYRKAIIIGILALYLAGAFMSWSLGPVVFVLAVVLPLYFVMWALIKKRRGGDEALIGLIVFISSLMYFNLSVYVGLSILIIIMLLSLSIHLGNERKEHERSMLRSSVLESQLLRKNIQPHFLMNTLTNIISLIESNPPLSIKLIEALSEEFYALIEMADKQLITIEKEVELCKAHLEIMSIRNDIQYDLSISIGESFLIPPAILHTLIENGITHNKPVDGKVQFSLSVSKNGPWQKLELVTYGVPNHLPEDIKEGTGLKYIRSRLEESFGEKWNISHSNEENKWVTEIAFVP